MSPTDKPPLPAAASAPPVAEPGAKRRPRPRQPPAGPDRPERNTPAGQRPAPAEQHPLLATLAQLYPALFGAKPLPLKRGIYEDLLAAQPEALPAEALKAALGQHARSTRYLQAMADGLPRHDLAGQPVELPTPEQVHHALIEVFRRRLRRTRADLRPELRYRIAQAFEASGLSREDYALRVLGRDEDVNRLTQEALADVASRAARDEALLRAFDRSGQTLEAFADMYGLPLPEARATLERARRGAAKGATQDAGPSAGVSAGDSGAQDVAQDTVQDTVQGAVQGAAQGAEQSSVQSGVQGDVDSGAASAGQTSGPTDTDRPPAEPLA